VLDACAPDASYVLVGQSLGGLIARLHAQQHPDRLAGLVPVDATPEAITDEPGVAVGFAVSGMLATVLKALAPLGFVRLLQRLRRLPLDPSRARSRPS
jgi:pimeloyl-ACP methyl ester carboxylesterase